MTTDSQASQLLETVQESLYRRGNVNAHSQAIPPPSLLISAQATLPGNGIMATLCSTGITSNSSLQGTSGVKVCAVYRKMNLYLIPNYTNTANKD